MILAPLRRSCPNGLNYIFSIALFITSFSPVFTKSAIKNRPVRTNVNMRDWTLRNLPYPRVQYHHIPNSDVQLQPEISPVGFIPDQNWFSISPKQEIVDMEPPAKEQPMKRRRIPGFPRDPPLPSVNITNVITLIQMAATDTEIDDQTEALLIQTLKEIMTFIGLQDTGDLLGMILMFFVMGPVLIPLYWMPIAILALGFLAIPIIYSQPLVVGGRQNYFGTNSISTSTSKSDNNLQSSQCLEMLSCEFNNFLRSRRWSSWISRKFKLTKVEWAGPNGKKFTKNPRRRSSSKVGYSEQEDCTKYSCLLIKPAQRFFGNWYSYIFTYQQPYDNI